MPNFDWTGPLKRGRGMKKYPGIPELLEQFMEENGSDETMDYRKRTL